MITIRQMNDSDLEPFAKIIADIKRSEFGAESSQEKLVESEVSQLSICLQAERSQYFVAEKNNEIIGGAGIRPLSGVEQNICEFGALFLRKDCRGIGTGKKLISICVETAQKQRYDGCYLETMTKMKAAILLYKKMGFAQLDRPLRTVPEYIDCWMLHKF